MRNRNDFSDLIGSEMENIMNSDEHKKIFTAPVEMTKTAAEEKKEDKKMPPVSAKPGSADVKPGEAKPETAKKDVPAAVKAQANAAVINDLVKIADVLSEMNLSNSEQLVDMLIESVALESSKCLRKEAKDDEDKGKAVIPPAKQPAAGNTAASSTKPSEKPSTSSQTSPTAPAKTTAGKSDVSDDPSSGKESVY